ncbi:glycosyltransferase [Flavobacterium sp. D11R37]|uniref:glycosyltransferase n=1 Tax=Flavobacterium coralii TaxID=2838017 RepID=UPI001CA65A63|nr:glycosyltransferase [Flavobacterium coralii]MBY8963325.1 glycosyltransferase [Flavobacterium coralii]
MNSIAVLIPHYNNPEGLVASLTSIDSSEEVDVIVVDDGSREKPDEAAAVTAFTAKGKLVFIYMDQNRGIEHALNRGLDYIESNSYTYIARLDCGDKNIGKRFAIQKKILQDNPDVKLIGSFARMATINGDMFYNLKFPVTTEAIRKQFYVNCMFIHPAVMFRVAMLSVIGKYPIEYKSAEDYAYFFKFVKGYKVYNIPEYLVKIELNPNGISATRRKQQVASRIKVIKHNFYFGFYPVYGLLRNIVLYYMPNDIILFIKSKIFR